VAALSFILYLPYYLTRNSGGFIGILPVPEDTTLLDFLQVFALFVFLVLSFLFVYCWQHREKYEGTRRKIILLGTVMPVVVLVSGVAFRLHVLPLLALIALTSVYGMNRFKGSDEKFALLLVLLGSLVAIFPEILYIVDAMPVARFNTIMKLHLQVWVMWGIASSYAIYYILGQNWIGRFKKTTVVIWSAAVVFMVFASLVHPVASTTSWTSGTTFFGSSTRGTLDGTAYLSEENIGDYRAIQWINRNITGMPVILEAPGSAYTNSSRISTLTGLPTVIGWTSHEIIWGSGWDKVDDRVRDVNTIYSTTDKERATGLLKKYNVKYVYVGDIEKDKYPRTGLQKFDDDELFEPVYNDSARIYKVK
jgi:YYY domain-containing protein